MRVIISVDVSYPFVLSKGLLSFDFNSLISLAFLCTNCKSDEYAFLQSSNKLVFENYQQIVLRKIKINFAES